MASASVIETSPADAPAMNGLQVVDIHVGVGLGGLDACMAQQLLDGSHIRPAAQQSRGVSVAEPVGRDDAREPCSVSGLTHDLADAGEPQTLAALRHEDRQAPAGGELAPPFVKVVLQRPPRGAGQRNQAAFAALAPANDHQASLEVHVIHIQRHHFAAAESAPEQDLEEGAVPRVQRRGRIARGDQRLELFES